MKVVWFMLLCFGLRVPGREILMFHFVGFYYILRPIALNLDPHLADRSVMRTDRVTTWIMGGGGALFIYSESPDPASAVWLRRTPSAFWWWYDRIIIGP